MLIAVVNFLLFGAALICFGAVVVNHFRPAPRNDGVALLGGGLMFVTAAWLISSLVALAALRH